jgi:hypothetical protein
VIGPLRAYVDESLRLSARLYLMAAVLVHNNRAEDHRAVLRGFLRKQQQRLHWRDENDRRRAALIATVADLRPRGVVVVGAGLKPRHQERARRKCIERLLWNLSARGVSEAVFERRHQELDRQDLQMINVLRIQRALPARLRVSWKHPADEALLWLPDIVAGAASLAEVGQETYWKELGLGLSVDRFNID